MFVTIVGGGHVWPQPGNQSGYSSPQGIWAFFSQFLTNFQALPKIVSQPVSNVQLSGQQASFHCAATGEVPMRYQWQKNGALIPGATSSAYTTPPTSTADNGALYRVIASNRVGSATSAPAMVTVIAAPADPAITHQPVSQSKLSGEPVTFSVTAAGTGTLRYQWMMNGMSIPGATGTTCALRMANTPESGATITVSVSNDLRSVMSAPATLTIAPAPGAPVITVAPARARVAQGQAASFWVTATGIGPLRYQWQRASLTTNFVDILGTNGPAYAIPALIMSDSRTLYRCIVSNRAGSTANTAEMVLVRAAAPQ